VRIQNIALQNHLSRVLLLFIAFASTEAISRADDPSEIVARQPTSKPRAPGDAKRWSAFANTLALG
jgi:hypothetical protein